MQQTRTSPGQSSKTIGPIERHHDEAHSERSNADFLRRSDVGRLHVRFGPVSVLVVRLGELGRRIAARRHIEYADPTGNDIHVEPGGRGDTVGTPSPGRHDDVDRIAPH